MNILTQTLDTLPNLYKERITDLCEVVYHPCGNDILYQLYHLTVRSNQLDFECKSIHAHYLINILIRHGLVEKTKALGYKPTYFVYSLTEQGKEFAEYFSPQVLKNPPTVLYKDDIE